jgi:nitrite reductase/ring-hydroxylating ferredoxin subunit
MNFARLLQSSISSNVIYYGQGIRGVYVFNTGSGYNAFEAACPNQVLSACSTMTLKGIVVCSCDNNEYSLFTGLSKVVHNIH